MKISITLMLDKWQSFMLLSGKQQFDGNPDLSSNDYKYSVIFPVICRLRTCRGPDNAQNAHHLITFHRPSGLHASN